MIKKHVLFVSAGRTDLKLLTAEGDTCRAIEISKKSTRLFHQWLLDSPEKYHVQHQGNDEVPLYQKALDEVALDVQVENGVLGLLAKEKEALDLLVDEQDRCFVVPIKLGRIVQELQKRVADQEIEVAAVVVFNTHRNETYKYGRDEPFAAGEVLAKWLANCFGLDFDEAGQYAEGNSVIVNILRNNEDQLAELSALNPAAINRIVASMVHFSQTKDLHATLCGIGGIPAFKSVIRNSAFFYFNQRCELAEDTETHQDNNSKPSFNVIGQQHILAEQSFLLRANIEKLIRSGDFLGAEAAVRHIEDKKHEAWIKPIRVVADLFRGVELEDYTLEDDRLDDLVQRIRASKLRCLLPALRTEAALQGDRIVEAINLTATFIDSAKWDGIARCLNDCGAIVSLDEFSRVVEFYGETSFPTSLIECSNDSKQNKVPLTHINESIYKIDTMYPCEQAWLNLSCPELIGLNRLINDRQKGRNNPYVYRNINTHGVLKPADLQAAKQAFINSKLWKGRVDKESDSSLFFLSQAQINPIFKYYGEEKVNELYRNLVRALVDSLRSFQFN